MKTNTHRCMIMLAVTLTLSLTTFSQEFLSGGYQGGTHGNIKYTLWSGAVDDNWAEPGNWCPAVVPDENADVVIPPAANVMPEVKSEGLSCRSLTIQPEAEVKIQSGFVLTVNGVETQ